MRLSTITRFSSHNVAHILIRTCIILWSPAMFFLDFVLWPSCSLPHLAYSPWFFFSANSLTSFRSFCPRSPVWVLFRPCTQVLLTRFITPTYFSLCHHLFLDHKFPTTSFFHGRMMSPPWFGRQPSTDAPYRKSPALSFRSAFD